MMCRETQLERRESVPSPHVTLQSARSYANMRENCLLSRKPRRARRAIERKEKSAPLWFSRVQVARLRECYYKRVHKRVLRFVL